LIIKNGRSLFVYLAVTCANWYKSTKLRTHLLIYTHYGVSMTLCNISAFLCQHKIFSGVYLNWRINMRE